MCLDNRQNFRNIKIIFRNMMFLIDSCTIIQANTQMTLTLHFLSLISLTVVRKSISRSSKSVERKRVWYILRLWLISTFLDPKKNQIFWQKCQISPFFSPCTSLFWSFYEVFTSEKFRSLQTVLQINFVFHLKREKPHSLKQ